MRKRNNGWTSWRTLANRWLILSIAIVASAGCGTAPTLPSYELPALTEDDKTAARPSLCEWPDFKNVTVAGVEYNALDADGWRKFLICAELFDLNVDIADANADGLEALAAMYEGAVAIAAESQHYAAFLINEIDADRRAAVVEAWTVKGILAAVLIGIAVN